MINGHSEQRTGPLEYESLPLHVSARSETGTLVVDVRGELDLATGPVLQQHLNHYCDQLGNGGPLRLVYRLSGVTFMDCSGLSALLNAIDGLDSQKITVREPTPPVRRVLELVGMAHLVEEMKP